MSAATFEEICSILGIAPTSRQRRKFERGEGEVYRLAPAAIARASRSRDWLVYEAACNQHYAGGIRPVTPTLDGFLAFQAGQILRRERQIVAPRFPRTAFPRTA